MTGTARRLRHVVAVIDVLNLTKKEAYSNTGLLKILLSLGTEVNTQVIDMMITKIIRIE